MNKLLLGAVFVGAAVVMPASANETETFCEGFASDNGWDTGPCSCVGEVGEADASVKDAILALSTPEDVDAMDQSVKDELAHCFPEDDSAATG